MARQRRSEAGQQDELALFDAGPEPEPVAPPAEPAHGPVDWPAFVDGARTTAAQKEDAANILIRFIEDRFPRPAFDAGVFGLLQSGPFSPDYHWEADRYWDRHFANTARQANWFQSLVESHHRDRSRRSFTEWADVEEAVLTVARERKYADSLIVEGRRPWSSKPLARGPKNRSYDGVAPQREYVFASTEFDTAEQKAKFADQLLAFIESGFDRQRFTRAFYNRLHYRFGDIAHYDEHGFYSERFSTTARQLEWLKDVVHHGTRGGWWTPDPRGDRRGWGDVERALAETIQDRNYVGQWTERLARERHTSERKELARLLALHPDMAVAPAQTDGAVSPARNAPDFGLF